MTRGIGAVLLIAFFLPAAATADHRRSRLLRLTQWCLAAATVADATSSWGMYEQNPLLRGQIGTFGPRGAAIKGGAAIGALLIQRYAVRKDPALRPLVISTNAALTGVFVGGTIHNVRMRTAQPAPR